MTLIKFIKERSKSVKYAINGAFYLVKTEHAVWAQSFFVLVFIILGLCLDITKSEWLAQIICFGLIFTAEGLNTAIEAICDFINPEYNIEIGKIKDLSAGAVAFSVSVSLICGLIIYIPYFF